MTARSPTAKKPPGGARKGAGRPKGAKDKNIQELRLLALDHSPRAFARIVELVESDDERVALAAAQEVLNRAYGKPRQEVGIEVHSNLASAITEAQDRTRKHTKMEAH